MRVPVVGIVSAIAAALGIYGMYWYDQLTPEQRERADRMAVDFAWDVYNTALEDLTSSQFQRIQGMVKARIG